MFEGEFCINDCSIFDMKKPSLRFRKGGVEEDVFNQCLGQPTSDNNLKVHAHMSVNIQLLVRLMCFLRS